MSPLLGTFRELDIATPNLPGSERLRLAETLSEDWWASAWQRVAEQTEGERVLRGLLSVKPKRQPTSRPTRLRPRAAGQPSSDVLDTIPPPEYVEALTGESVPERGGSIRCPLPGHDDRSPSCYVYADPGRGWYCHGCHRGGSAIDLAAELTGTEPREEGYWELRSFVVERLLGAVAA